MNKDLKIAAVVITFNRLNYLIELIDSLRYQTLKLSKIIVINNGSTDGTMDWLNNQEDLQIIHQANVGSSGGQFTGFKTAYDNGYDYIWTMDDDVIPTETCLEKLTLNLTEKRIHAPLRYNEQGIPFLNDVKRFNLTNPFKSIWDGVFTEDDIQKEYIPAEGITFEGPIFHRSLIEIIGLPERHFFIHADDSDYFIRAKNAGFEIFIVRDARSNRKLAYSDPDEKFTWKHYYVIRNVIALDVLHGNLPVRLLRPWAYLLKWIFTSKSINDLKITIKAFKDGYFYKSNNLNNLEKDTERN